MPNNKAVWVSVILAAATCNAQNPSKPSPTLSDRIDQVRGSVVRVTADPKGQVTSRHFSAGSGFIVNDDGYIITANHVIHPPGLSPTVEITTGVYVAVPPFATSGMSMTASFSGSDATVVDVDVSHDLALLHAPGIMHVKGAVIDGPPVHEYKPKVTVATLLSRTLKDGDSVFVSGYPLTNPVLITNAGFVASSVPVALDESTNTLVDAYWLDMRANPGNSGGPLFSLRTGSVIGVVVSVETTAVKFLDGQHEDVGVNVNGPNGTTIVRGIGYNAGIARAISGKYVVELLRKNHVKGFEPQSVPRPKGK